MRTRRFLCRLGAGMVLCLTLCAAGLLNPAAASEPTATDVLPEPLEQSEVTLQNEALLLERDQLTPSELDSIITNAMSTYHIAGVSALVIHDTDVVWAGAYGYANLADSTPVADSTVFLVASISKTFVTNAVMQLWQSGTIDLDADINTYLPFSVINPHFPDSIITLRMLLTHSSSIAREDSIWINRREKGGDHPTPLGDFLQDYLVPGGALYDSGNYLLEAPGTYRLYSNWGFGLAGYIVEQVSGVSLEQYSQDSLFGPLGMTETSWFLSGLDLSNVATPYYWSGSDFLPYIQYGIGIYPCGQVRTSAPQLARHLMAFMRHGEVGGQRILDSATVDTIMSSQYAGPGLDPDWVQGLGWYGVYDGVDERWGHGGNLLGCRAAMYFHTTGQSGYVLMENGDRVNGHQEIHVALRMFSKDSDLDGLVDGLDDCQMFATPGDVGINTGDVNTDGVITSQDIIGLVGYVFKSGAPPAPCEASGDANCSGNVTSADIIYLVSYVFKSGPLPCNICQAAGLGWSCP